MSSIYFTLGCTLSSVSFPPAGWQTPQCRRNAEQSLVSRVESCILVRTRNCEMSNRSPKEDQDEDQSSQLLTCWLLPCCRTALEGWRARSTQWRRKPGGSACGWSSHSGERRRSKMCNHWESARDVDSTGWRILKSTFCTRQCAERIRYLVEVPHCVGQSSPRRVVRLPHPVGVAGDVQVHAVLDVLLAVTCTFQDFDCILLLFVEFLSVMVAIVSNDHKSAQWVNDLVE